MKKHTEKQPIDDLFARKLGNMSLPPSADGFGRLQARITQNRPEARVVFWRNPVVQRYMTAAACLLLVCLFGWRYWPSATKTTTETPRIATKPTSPTGPQHPDQQPNLTANRPTPDAMPTVASTSNQKPENIRLAHGEKQSKNTGSNRSGSQPVGLKKAVSQPEAPIRSEPVLAQTKPAEHKANSEVKTAEDLTSAHQSTPELVADHKIAAKSTPIAERVLVVTIAEPASLVAARQAAQAAAEEKPILATTDKSGKEAKAGSLWQQVKRLKQGELFAHRDNAGNDDRGLLGRAYSGLKHSFDKDKSAKQ